MKFTTTPLKNENGNPHRIVVQRGSNVSFLQDFARFGMLGFKELNLLYDLHEDRIYKKLRAMRAENNKLISYNSWQLKHKHQHWATDLFYELADHGRLENEKRGVPDYNPPAGSDFEHRAMAVRWAVSFHAGVRADPRVRFEEWPEIRERAIHESPTIHLDDKHTVNTDWPPFGVVFDDEHNNFTRGPEIDRNTERGDKVDHKFLAHVQVFEQDLAYKQLDLPSDFIPWVTVSEARKQRLMRDLERLIATGKIKKRWAVRFCFAVFPDFGSPEPLDTRAYTMPYERVGYPDFHFNQPE